MNAFEDTLLWLLFAFKLSRTNPNLLAVILKTDLGARGGIANKRIAFFFLTVKCNKLNRLYARTLKLKESFLFSEWLLVSFLYLTLRWDRLFPIRSLILPRSGCSYRISFCSIYRICLKEHLYDALEVSYSKQQLSTTEV